jgi:quercetin dioxygenase-like cupin family protein
VLSILVTRTLRNQHEAARVLHISRRRYGVAALWARAADGDANGRLRLTLFSRLQQETTMNTRTTSLLLAICAGGVWALAHARNADTSVVKLPQDIIYKGLSGAPQHVTLFGDPSEPGLYVDRIKFMPGMKVMPHWHPDMVRTVLVMSGTFYFAVGEQWDESKLKAYPAGTLYSEPARSPHYAWAKDGEVILQVTGIGPTGNVPIPQKSRQ